jgi:hypothetical protein
LSDAGRLKEQVGRGWGNDDDQRRILTSWNVHYSDDSGLSILIDSYDHAWWRSQQRLRDSLAGRSVSTDVPAGADETSHWQDRILEQFSYLSVVQGSRPDVPSAESIREQANGIRDVPWAAIGVTIDGEPHQAWRHELAGGAWVVAFERLGSLVAIRGARADTADIRLGLSTRAVDGGAPS